jgi:hypothetical protein
MTEIPIQDAEVEFDIQWVNFTEPAATPEYNIVPRTIVSGPGYGNLKPTIRRGIDGIEEFLIANGLTDEEARRIVKDIQEKKSVSICRVIRKKQ